MVFISDFFTLHTYTLFTDAATVFVIFKWMNPSIYRLKYCKACTIHVLLIECLVHAWGDAWRQFSWCDVCWPHVWVRVRVYGWGCV